MKPVAELPEHFALSLPLESKIGLTVGLVKAAAEAAGVD